MADARFHIVFTGQLVKGSDLATVKANLGKIFKMEAPRVEKLFSGQPVVLKKDADQATAMKFRAVLKQAGAECELRPVAEAATPPSAPHHPPPRHQRCCCPPRSTGSHCRRRHQARHRSVAPRQRSWRRGP